MLENPILAELFEKFLVYLDRQVVRAQFDAILIAVVAGLVIAGVIIFLLDRLAPKLDERPGKAVPYLKHALSFAKRLAFPIAGLVTLRVTLASFVAQNALVGIIEKAIYLFILLLVYQLGLAIAYKVFEHSTMRRFHYRLIGPSFTLFILYQITSDFVHFPALGEIALVDRTDDPLTIGTLFLVLVGVYFWINSVIGVGEIIQGFTARYTKIPLGKIKGTLTLARYLLIGIGVYFGLANLGLDSTTIAAITGGLSVGIGFGLKEVLSSFIGGLIILFEGSIQPGDILTFDGGGVNVKKMGIRSTLVRKPDGTEILIPNAKLFTSQVIKRTGTDDYVRATIKIRASYKQDPTKVIAILEKIGQSHPKVSSTPKPPKAFMEDFGEYGIVYRLHVWVDHRVIDPIGIKWNINMRIYEAFREHGIEIPVPQMNVQLNSLSPLSLVEPDAVPIE